MKTTAINEIVNHVNEHPRTVDFPDRLPAARNVLTINERLWANKKSMNEKIKGLFCNFSFLAKRRCTLKSGCANLERAIFSRLLPDSLRFSSESPMAPSGSIRGYSLIYALTLTATGTLFAQSQLPSISSVPGSFTPGVTFQIRGTNFHAITQSNIVSIDGMRVPLLSSSITNLTLVAPTGAVSGQFIVQIPGSITVMPRLPSIETTGRPGIISSSTFSPSIFGLTDQGIQAYTVTKGDFDQDGKIDLAIAHHASHQVSIWLNRSTATSIVFVQASFSPAITTSPWGLVSGDGAYVHHPTAFDLDGDGRQDLLVSNFRFGSLSIWRNIGSAGNIAFSNRVDLLTGGFPNQIAVADLNRDGRLDVLVAVPIGDSVPGKISIFLGRSAPGPLGNQTFPSRIDIATGTVPNSIAANDLDGNGMPDVIVSEAVGRAVTVFRNTTPAGTMGLTFGSTNTFLVIPPVGGMILADINRDSKIDVLGSGPSDGTGLWILENASTAGQISFRPLVGLLPGTSAVNATVADLNGDGLLDIATLDGISNSIVVLETLATGRITPSNFSAPIYYPLNNASAALQAILAGVFTSSKRPDLIVTFNPNRNSGQTPNEVFVLRNNLQPSKPVITSQPTNDFVVFGNSVALTVQAEGRGLSYQWFLNGTNLLSNNSRQATLLINNAGASNAGVYHVVVSNSVGPVTSSDAVLTVLGIEYLVCVQIYGKVDASYLIESMDIGSPGAAWQAVTNITVSSSPFVWCDPTSSTNQARAYRARLN